MISSRAKMQRINKANLIFMTLYLMASVAVSSALFFYLFYNLNLASLGFK